MKKLRLLFICLPLSIFAQVSTKELTPFPGDARDDAVAVFHEGKVYAGFGLNAGFAYENDWYIYDTLGQQWHELASAPMAPRQYIRYFQVGDSLYLFGGTTGNDSLSAFGDFWLYSFHENRWEELKRPPLSPRWAGVGFSNQGFGYLGLGTNGHENFTDFWQFNPRQRSWKKLADFPAQARAKSVGLAGNNKAVVAGGLTETATVFTVHHDIWYFNFLTQSWQNSFQNLQHNGAYHYATTDGEQVYILGGYNRLNGRDTTYRQLQVLSIAANTLDTLKLPQLPFRRGGNMMAVGQGQFYILWGLNTSFLRVNDFYALRINTAYEPMAERQLYPNPSTNGRVWLQVEYLLELRLFSFEGRLLEKRNANPQQHYHLLDFKELSAGVYLLQLHLKGGETEVLRLFRD